MVAIPLPPIRDLINKVTSMLTSSDSVSDKFDQSEHDMERHMVRAFLVKNAIRLQEWVKTNPNQRPPVYFNPKTKEVTWLNRDQRRKQMTRNRKKGLGSFAHLKAASKNQAAASDPILSQAKSVEESQRLPRVDDAKPE